LTQISTVLAIIAFALAGNARATEVPGQGTWETTLLGRAASGLPVAASSSNAVFFYDTTLDVTWLRTTSSGLLNFADAQAWASQERFGISGWRLPAMVDTGSAGCNFSLAGGTDCGQNVQTVSPDGTVVYSEMAHLYYVTLGNKAYCAPGDTVCSGPQLGYDLKNTAYFQNLTTNLYWTNLPASGTPAVFSTTTGDQYFPGGTGNVQRVIAVRSGDVLAVPEMGTTGMMLAGLAALLLLSRGRRQSILR